MLFPKVSVIIPVYNAEPFLRECLDSVVNQTLQEIEIICVDDGSTDGSLGILHEYEARDERFRVLTQANINAGAARNRGLDVARGEYLSFLDADDFFEPEMLERAYEHARSCEAEILVYRCDLYITEEDRYTDRRGSIVEASIPEIQPFPGTAVKGNLFLTFVGWAWDKLISREYIQVNSFRFQEQRTTNDLFFIYLALAKAQRIATIDDLFAHHRIQLETSLEATRDKSWDCFYKALLALRDGLRKEGLFDLYERDFINYSVMFALWNLYSLSWPIQEVLFYLLKHVWLNDLSVTEKDESYFDNKAEYRKICEVLHGEYVEMFPEGGSVYRYRSEIAELKSLNATLQNENATLQDENATLQDENATLQDENATLQDENATSRNENAILEGERKRLQNDLSALQGSVSFRFGRVATFLPRKIRDGVCQIKERDA